MKEGSSVVSSVTILVPSSPFLVSEHQQEFKSQTKVKVAKLFVSSLGFLQKCSRFCCVCGCNSLPENATGLDVLQYPYLAFSLKAFALTLCEALTSRG